MPGEVSAGWKLTSRIQTSEKGLYFPRNLFSLTSAPGKIMEKVIPGAVDTLLKDDATTGHAPPGSMKGKSRPSDLMSCCDKAARLADDGKAVGVVFLGFLGRLLDPVPPSILPDEVNPAAGRAPGQFAGGKLGGAGDSLEGREPGGGIWLDGRFGRSSTAGNLRRINAGFCTREGARWWRPSFLVWVTT